MRRRTWRGSDELRESARDLRRKLTPAERILWSLLRNHQCGGYAFRRQVPIGQFVLDFYCPTAQFAIEVDGGVHTDPAVKARDMDRQKILEEYGICFLRLSNDDVLNQSAIHVTQRVIAVIENRLGNNTRLLRKPRIDWKHG